MVFPSFEPGFVEETSSAVIAKTTTINNQNDNNNNSKGRYVLGLTFILLQCIVWISASVITQYLYDVFPSTFLMTYVGVSLLAVYIPVRYIFVQTKLSNDLTAPHCDSFDTELANSTTYMNMVETISNRTKQLGYNYREWNHKKHFLAAINITPAMFLADWAFNGGLAHTSVASSTVLVSTSSVFVFIFAVILHIEQFHWMKLLGVILAVIGTALTTLHDDDNNDNDNDENDNIYNKKWLGDLLSLMAAIGYATYTVQVRVLCPQNEDLYSMTLLLGYVGCISCVTLLPIAIYCVLQVTITWKIFICLIGKGMLDFVITDYLLFRSVILTNATIASVGLGLTIPLAFFADWVLDKLQNVTIASVSGAIAVATGFLIVNLIHTDSEEENNVNNNQNESKTKQTEDNNETNVSMSSS